MTNTNPARGMRDFLPADVRKREYVIGIIKAVYESYGFEPLETPAVENIETLTGKYGEEGNQLIYKILKRGEKLDASAGERELSDLALRYDLTVPLARVVANRKNDLPKFFKRYQIQPVWRADRPARGRFREFYQCDVDAIGSSSMIVEAELISAVCEILKRLGFEDFAIRINHREVLRGILDAAGIPIEKHIDALTALDKVDKIGSEGVLKEFNQRNIASNEGQKLLAFFDVFFSDNWKNKFSKTQIKKLISIDERLNLIKNYTVKNESDSIKMTLSMKEAFKKVLQDSGIEDESVINEVLDEKVDTVKIGTGLYDLLSKYFPFENKEDFENSTALATIQIFIDDKSSAMENKGIAELNKLLLLMSEVKGSNLKIDPSLARGLSYYTGAIFEIVLTNGDFAGSIGGGGRYDGLIGMFGKEQIPACGFSLGLERILVVMEERGMFPPELTSGSADVLVTVWNADAIGESLKLANELRRENLRVLVYPEADKLGKQFKYADSIKIPFVCVLGESELAENKVTLKNLRTGEQETIDRSEVSQKVKS